mmetsp:Transcript_23588/g.51296  ORF Transcript_23588/g.51296 Transcript_23588/m.51296 type:complete len:255 (+) Transcript_23588:788-1552(+)
MIQVKTKHHLLLRIGTWQPLVAIPMFSLHGEHVDSATCGFLPILPRDLPSNAPSLPQPLNQLRPVKDVAKGRGALVLRGAHARLPEQRKDAWILVVLAILCSFLLREDTPHAIGNQRLHKNHIRTLKGCYLQGLQGIAKKIAKLFAADAYHIHHGEIQGELLLRSWFLQVTGHAGGNPQDIPCRCKVLVAGSLAPLKQTAGKGDGGRTTSAFTAFTRSQEPHIPALRLQVLFPPGAWGTQHRTAAGMHILQQRL